MEVYVGLLVGAGPWWYACALYMGLTKSFHVPVQTPSSTQAHQGLTVHPERRDFINQR
jgi:hypothetical protein